MTYETITSVTSALAYVLLAVDLSVRLWLLFYVPKNRKPTAAMAWLLLIFIIPVFGTILFFILGSTSLSKKRRADQKQINYMLHRYMVELRRQGLISTVARPYDEQEKLARAFTSLGSTRKNAVHILDGYDSIIKQMTHKVTEAKEYIYAEFYVLAMDDTTEPFFQAVEEAIQRGVSVRILFDAYGSRKYPHRRKMMRRLTDMGAEWHQVLPFTLRPKYYNRPDLRNHRKILVIDNTDAYIGSLNLIDKTYHRKDDISYLELVAHLQGPSVNECAAVFASDWYAETGEFLNDFMKNSAPSKRGTANVQIVPSGSNYPYENNLRVFTSLIHSARKSISITNPYLVPDEALLGALISAAQRGVKVSILNSEAMDQWMVGHAQRSYYDELIRAGITINLYHKPQLVHEKFLSVDDEVGIIGSSNLDIRSFQLNLECIAVIYDRAIAKKLRKHHDELLQHSTRVQLEAWRRRSYWQSFLDSIARLTAALQ